MKRFFSIRKLVVAALVACICSVTFVACNPDNQNPPTPPAPDYKITVYDVDGSPCSWVGLQVCYVAADGSLGACNLTFKYPDQSGVAYFDVEDDKLDTNANHIEVHLFAKSGHKWPVHVTYDKPRMHKGESVTIRLRNKTGDELDSPSRGTGVGAYLTGDDANKINLTQGVFDPYIVANGSVHELKFTSADQKIYFALPLSAINDYKVYVVGGINVKIVELIEQVTDLVNDGQRSVSGVDCVYEYTTTTPNQAAYFEISLANASDVNKSALICFDKQ